MQAVEKGGSDIYLIPGVMITIKVNEVLLTLSERLLNVDDCVGLIKQIYILANGRDTQRLKTTATTISHSVEARRALPLQYL